MPIEEVIGSSGVFGGIPTTGALSGEHSPAALPRGFNAVAQMDLRLLQAQLRRSLQASGLETLRAQIPFVLGSLPSLTASAIEPHAAHHDTFALAEMAVEVRLLDPVLQTLDAAPAHADAAVAADVSGDRHIVEIGWTVELNVLRTERELVVSTDVPTPGRTRHAELGGFAVSANPDPDRPVPLDPNTTRTRVAQGKIRTRSSARTASRPELLQAWLELDTARTAIVLGQAEPALLALLESVTGQEMIGTALSRLTSAPATQLSPRIAVAGGLSAHHSAELGWSAMTVRHTVHSRPAGGEVLSLAFTFGEDAGGALSELQPFLGRRNFAYYISRETLAPILAMRWRLRPSARDFVGNLPVDMPLHAGTEQVGEGLVRLHVRLGDEISFVRLTAIEGQYGDVLQLACNEDLHLLAAWYANGSPVSDLGELGKPITLPFVVSIAPFSPAPTDTDTQTPFRDFLLEVLEPLALPMIERFPIYKVDGFLSEALGACVGRWSMPPRTREVAEDLLDRPMVER